MYTPLQLFPSASVEAFAATARWAGASDEALAAAAACTHPRLLVSGRLASGKDTLARAAMDAIGYRDAVPVSFATAIRREVDEVLDLIRHLDSVNRSPANAAEVVHQQAPMSRDLATSVATLALEALESDGSVHSRVRTPQVRRLLQLWGTDVRRAVDPDYWVKQTIRSTVEILATDRAVFITDARFVNEVEQARALGFCLVRVEVDPAVRSARLAARDGLDLDPAAERHPSELQLATYEHFDAWVDNSGALEVSVGHVVAHLAKQFLSAVDR
jgi:dephospho-CoA kinase